MKTKLLILGLLVAVNAAFAQGKIGFVNDSLHLYVWGPGGPGDLGQPISITPSGITFVSGLYAGTSSTSLALQSSTTLLTGTGLPQAGRQASRNTVLTIPGGVPQWFRILIWDSAYPAPDGNQLWPISGSYVGWSDFFQATPGTSLTYPSIMPGGPSASTLPAGNIFVPTIPEPSSASLFLLALALVRFSHRPSVCKSSI